MKIPEQCEKCIKLDICKENNCMKEKPCLQKVETKPVDPDLIREMRERIGI
jgi:hypothetical protein